MRLRHLLFVLLLCTQLHAQEKIDFLDYFVQSDDIAQSWTLGGSDIIPEIDPEGSGEKILIHSKFSNPNCFEVYKVTDTDIQCRWEVVRSGGETGTKNWIRRFEEFKTTNKAPGALWVKRHMTPGGEGVLSEFTQDKFKFDEKTRSYVFSSSGSPKYFATYLSIEWANPNLGENNQTGFDLSRVLRLISQWQREGKMIEFYDYAKGKGIVGWHWLERLSSMTPWEGDTTGKIFHCEETGCAYVESMGDAKTKPVVYQYDPKTKKMGRKLEVVSFTSYWKKDLGPQWYVMYRDLFKEQPLKKKTETIPHSYALPEAGIQLKDLPYINTHAPR